MINLARCSFLSVFSLLLFGNIQSEEYPGARWTESPWERVSPESSGMKTEQLHRARDYALTGGGSGRVIVRGKRVLAWGDQEMPYDLKSTSKSIGVTLLGIALKDEKVKWDDSAARFHPNFAVPPESNRETDWIPKITIRMLVDQTAGFDKPGKDARLLFEPGTMWNYSDAGPNWLAECLTLVYGRDLNEILLERVLAPIGVTTKDIRWRKHAYRPEKIEGITNREFGSGFHANVNALSRIGYLYLREGKWQNEQLLPTEFVRGLSRSENRADLPTYRHGDKDEFGPAARHYSTLWWNNADETIPEVPRDAFWAWGLYDSLIFVVPSLDLVAVRAGHSWPRKSDAGHYDVLKPFFVPLVAACSE